MKCDLIASNFAITKVTKEYIDLNAVEHWISKEEFDIIFRVNLKEARLRRVNK